jgi:hypothetical protein
VTAAPSPNSGERTGAFNYLAASVESSLYRNGRVLTRRDPDGSDSGTEGIVVDKREMTVHDARRLGGESRRTVAVNGFELLQRPLGPLEVDFLQHEQVVESYYGHCAQIVREVTGAAHVFPFDHNVRSAQGKKSMRRIAGGQQVQAPAHFVHGDYTLSSAPQRLRELARPPGRNDTLRPFLAEGEALIPQEMVDRVLERGGRFAIINVWRNIAEEPVAARPVAFCDAQSVQPEDLVVFEIHYSDRVGENYFSKPSPRHRWYFFPEVTRDEALLIKQWDSAGTLARSKGAAADSDGGQGPCTFSFHSAFKDPSTPPDAPDRWSIEVRCAVLYEQGRVGLDLPGTG